MLRQHFGVAVAATGGVGASGAPRSGDLSEEQMVAPSRPDPLTLMLKRGLPVPLSAPKLVYPATGVTSSPSLSSTLLLLSSLPSKHQAKVHREMTH